MKKLLILFSALFALSALGQSTTISSTIIDPLGNSWNYGTVTAVFRNAPGASSPPVWSGGTLNPIPPTVALSSSGSFTMTLPSTNYINPAGGTWTFSVCPNSSQPCAVFNTAVIGTTLDIEPLITAANAWPSQLVISTPVAKVYNVNQTFPPPLSQGGMLYDTTTQAMLVYTNTGWQPFATVGSGVPILSNPPGSQTITQPINTFFNFITSGTGGVDINGVPVITGAGGVVPIANGGTGQTTGIAALNALGVGPGTTPFTLGYPFTALSVNNVVNVALQVGSDLGAQMAAAITYLGSTCGVLQIPTGTYTWTTGNVIVPVCDRIEGEGSVINVSTGSEPPLIQATYGLPSGPTAIYPGGIDDITFSGPYATGPTVGVIASYGPWIGGDLTGTLTIANPTNYYANVATYRNLHVRGFGCGLEMGQGTQIAFIGGSFEENGAGMCYMDALSENMNFHGTQVVNNFIWGFYSPGIGSSEFQLFGSSFDYNGQNLYQTFTGTTNATTTVTVSSTTGLYVGMEIGGTNIPVGDVITAVGSGTVTILTAATGSGSGIAMTANGGQMIISGPYNLTIHGGHMESNETPYIVIPALTAGAQVEIQDMRWTLAQDNAASVESIIQFASINGHLRLDGDMYNEVYQSIENGILDWTSAGGDNNLFIGNFFGTSEGNGYAQPVFKTGSFFSGYYTYPIFNAGGDNIGTSTNRTINGVSAPLASGFSVLVAGTVMVSNAAACSPSASCTYEFTRCGGNASTAVGVPSLSAVSVGTSFTITSLTATNTTATGDLANVCWRIN